MMVKTNHLFIQLFEKHLMPSAVMALGDTSSEALLGLNARLTNEYRLL